MYIHSFITTQNKTEQNRSLFALYEYNAHCHMIINTTVSHVLKTNKQLIK